MRKIFVKTQNVKNFINMMNNIKNRPETVPGMALVYGEPGLGKSKAVLICTEKSRQPFSEIMSY